MFREISNFGRNVEFQPAAIYHPDSVNELLEILNRHRGQEIRAVGSLHSWSPAPSTTGVMVVLRNLALIEIDRDGSSTLISMVSPGARVDEDWYSISLISYQWPSDRKGFFAFAEFVSETFAQLFEARCHWGKYQPLDRERIESLYPQIGEFRDAMERFDPTGAFKNAWFRQLF